MAEKTIRYGQTSGSEIEEFDTTTWYNLTVSGINNCADQYIAPYSKITKVIVHAEAYQTIALGSTKSDMDIYFRESATTVKRLATVLEKNESIPKNQWTTFEADATKYFNTSGSNLGRVNVSGAGTLTYANQATVIRTLKLRECYVRWYWTTPTFVISLTAGTGGTVSGAGTYEVGSTATIKATPNSGYKFVKWSDGNTNAERQITITSSDISANVTNRSYTATFEKIKYTISVSGSNGTVSGGGTYENGSSVTLTATPNSGYKFVKWSDGNTSNPRTITVSGNATYTAVFEKSTCTITFKNADGSVVSTKTLNSGATLGTVFKELPTVSRSGYTFGGWIPCAPAVKTYNSVLDSYQYNGDKDSAKALNTKYKYTDKLSVHIEAYMDNWEDIKNRQIISCTEGGGWSIGYQANTTGHGSELYAGGYKGIDLGFGTSGIFSDKTWYSFDLVFANGLFEVYVNGVKKGSQTTANTTISYNADNTIFVGAEAGKNATTPGGNYFKGYISNVFIANQGTRLQIATTSTVVEKNIDYYPIWRKNTKINKIFVGTSQPKAIYIGMQEVKEVYFGTTKVYG